MGVKDLWTILSPTCERKSLYELQGKAVAVDLSGWVVEDQTVASYSTQPRMYLRNLFFRTTCLLMLDVRPVFVLEGDAPSLKHDTMARRKEAQQKSHAKHHGPSQSQPSQSQNVARRGTRSRLKSLLKQCEALLSAMGVGCVQSVGEAEALCAQLNAAGLVEGCISQDGDCFLYGANTVYRNFTISSAGHSSSSGFSVDVFEMGRVQRDLSLGRNKLVALALLLGCDYSPGVPGVGKVAAMAFLAAVAEDDVLDRMLGWRSDPCLHRHDNDAKGLGLDSLEGRKAEMNIRKKALGDPDFPSREVMSEFLEPAAVAAQLDTEWRQPDLPRFVELAVKLLSWTETYAVEKLFPLSARWRVSRAAAHDFPFTPTEIVKKRVHRGVASYELRWHDNDGYLATLTLDEGKTAQDLLVSVEPQPLVQRSFPRLAAQYEEATALAKKTGKKKVTRKTKENATQPTMDLFLLPGNAAPSNNKQPRAATKKPAKKPQVTIASLMRQMAVIERGKIASSPLKPSRRNLAAPSPRLSPIAAKRFASPRLKVGFKTRRLTTPVKSFLVKELERSFRNVSLVDYSEDDGDFSDLSAIIDGIVGFPDEKVGDRESAAVAVFEPSSGATEPQAAVVESDDEFDFCDLKIVPLHVKLGSQLLM